MVLMGTSLIVAAGGGGGGAPGPGHPTTGNEFVHIYVQAAAPVSVEAGGSDPLAIGDIWSDTTANVLKRCTGINPDIFTSVEGGGVSFAAPSETIDIGDAAAEGVAATALRSDAQFAFTAPGAGYPVDTDFTAEDDGAATTPARSDHRHNIPAPAAPIGDVDIGDAAAAGSGGQPAREDHQHAFPAPGAGYPEDVAAAESDGIATTPARADHVHAHGSGFSPDAHQPRSHDHSNSLDGNTLQPLNFDFTAAALLTIAVGDITATQNFHRIAGEGAAADDLDGIAGGTAGRWLVIRPDSDTITITVRHNQNPAGTNNILLADASNFVMDDIQDTLYLLYDATIDTNGAWMEVSRSVVPGSSSFAAPTGNIDIADAAVEGVAATHSRSDHQHQFDAPGAGYPVDTDFTAEADGAATTPARSDHRHNIPAPAAPTGDVDIGDTASAGAGGQPAREDHEHAHPAPASGYPVDTDFNAENDGAATTPARSDHRHNIPAPAAPTTVDIGDTAAAGAASSPSRADHIHGFPAPGAGYPQDVDGTEADGTATTPARSDHVHAMTSSMDALHDIEVWISGAAMKGAVTAGAGDADNLPESAETSTNGINYDFLAFDQTTEEEAFFQWKIPQGWDEGTITYQPVWTAASGTGTVQWGLKSLARGNSDPLDTAYGSETTTTALTLDAAEDVMFSAESGAHTIGGTPVANDIVLFAISRKTGGDTLTADARLLGIIITYTRNAYGD